MHLFYLYIYKALTLITIRGLYCPLRAVTDHSSIWSCPAALALQPTQVWRDKRRPLPRLAKTYVACGKAPCSKRVELSKGTVL